MKPKQLREWLFQNGQEDQWWLCIDTVTEESPLTVAEIEEYIASGDYGTVQALHVSQSEMSNPPWIDVELPSQQPAHSPAMRTPIHSTTAAAASPQNQVASNVPPPLTGSDVDNKFIWAVVAVPIVGVIIELLAGTELVWLHIVANIVCCVLDEKKLKKAGQKAPTNWMVFLVPVYLWKRASLLNQKKHYFWAWWAAFVLSILIGMGGHQAALEEAARPVVSQIIKEQLFGSATCKAVTIDEEVTDGFYKATATLDNGNEWRITIEERKDGQIYVQIPNQ